MALNSIIKLEPNVSLKILSQYKSQLKILWKRLKKNLYHIVYNVNKLENQYIQVFELKTIINFMVTLVDINIEGQSIKMLREIFTTMMTSNEKQKTSHVWLDNMLELLEFVLF